MIYTLPIVIIKKVFTINTALVVVVAILVFLLLFSSLSAQATPASARSAIKGGYPLYVSGDAVGGTCAATSTAEVTSSSGDEESRKKAIWAYLRTKMNLSAPQAAGAMGNLKQENSTFDPTVRQNNPPSPEIVVDGKSGYGIVQWTSRNRQQSLEDFAKEISQSSGNLDTQLQFITKEINASYKEMLAALTATDDPAEAAKIWHGPTNEASSIIPLSTYDFAGYEASGDDAAGIQERIDSAISILNELGDGSGSYSSAGCTTDNQNIAAGEFSLPLDPSFFDSMHEDFVKRHHDYPSSDIGVKTGTKVYSMTSGEVIDAPIVDIQCIGCKSGSYGRGVKIRYDKDTVFIYAHGTDGGDIEGAKVGDTVSAGQFIMHSGATGNTQGDHLHLEIIYKGDSVCPQYLMEAIGTNSPIPAISSLPSGNECVGSGSQASEGLSF